MSKVVERVDCLLQSASGVRVVKLLFSLILGRGLMAARQLLVVPVYLTCWGTDCYGEWLMLSSLPSLLIMSNLGIGTAAATQVGIEGAAGNARKASVLFSTTVTAIAIIAFVAIVAALFIAFMGAFPLVGSLQHIAAGHWVLAALICNVMLRMFHQVQIGWWVASGKPAAADQWGNLLTFGELLIALSVPIFGGAALVLVLAQLLWLLIWLPAYSFATKKLMRAHLAQTHWLQFHWKECKELIAVGIGHQLRPLCQAIYFQGSILLAGFMLGPSGAAAWGALRVATRVGNQVIEVLSLGIGPEFQLAYGKQDFQAFFKIYSRGTQYSLFIAALIAVAGIAFLPYVFLWWTAGKLTVPHSVWIPLQVSLIAFSGWRVGDEMFRNANLPWRTTVLTFIASLISIGVMYSLSSHGLWAFAFGTVLFDSLLAIGMTIQVFRLKRSTTALTGIVEGRAFG